MSPRPRTTSDDEILDALSRVLSRVGPDSMTLADVSGEAELSPAGLVQRFGSKRELLLALAERHAAQVHRRFVDARARNPSPGGAMMEALAGAMDDAATPAALAHQLAFSLVFLDDTEFHRAAFEHARGMLDEIGTSLHGMVAAGELMPCDTTGVARTVQTTWNGALLTWAVYRQGSLAEWLRGEVEAVLEPWLPPLPAVAADIPAEVGTARAEPEENAQAEVGTVLVELEESGEVEGGTMEQEESAEAEADAQAEIGTVLVELEESAEAGERERSEEAEDEAEQEAEDEVAQRSSDDRSGGSDAPGESVPGG